MMRIDDVCAWLRRDWADIRPFEQAFFFIQWALGTVAIVWLLPMDIFPWSPLITYQLQILATALVGGALLRPVIVIVTYPSIVAWEADIVGVSEDKWRENFEDPFDD